MVSQVIFFHRGLTAITLESVAETLYDFLLHIVGGRTPEYVDKTVCNKFTKDLSDANKYMLAGAAESIPQLVARREILCMKNNCVALYSKAADYYNGYGAHGSPQIELALEQIDCLLAINGNFPMPHYLRARIYLDYLLIRKNEKERIKCLEREYRNGKVNYYKKIISDSLSASLYGIGGAFEILGDLIDDNNCPEEAKEEIGVEIAPQKNETRKELIRRKRRHLYRFGEYCDNAPSAFKLAKLIDARDKEDCRREKMEALSIAAKFGEPEACFDLIRLTIENNLGDIYGEEIMMGLNCICCVTSDDRVMKNIVEPLMGIAKKWYDNGEVEFVLRLREYTGKMDQRKRILGILIGNGYYDYTVSQIDNWAVTLRIKQSKKGELNLFNSSMLFA